MTFSDDQLKKGIEECFGFQHEVKVTVDDKLVDVIGYDVFTDVIAFSLSAFKTFLESQGKKVTYEFKKCGKEEDEYMVVMPSLIWRLLASLQSQPRSFMGFR